MNKSLKHQVITSGNTVTIVPRTSAQVSDTLPPQVYSVGFDSMAGQYFLNPIESFTMPSKIYGDTLPVADRFFRTFQSRPGSTGIHLDGMKGSGKTLLAKKLACMAIEAGYPVLVVNQAHCGEGFNKFMQSIEIPCVVLFDEFEKVYDRDNQDAILTLFDGVYPSKKLFIITTNDNSRVSQYLTNRPGRIYYSMRYTTLGEAFIKEYAQDNLEDKSKIEALLMYCRIFDSINFDMLQGMIEEMNRYGESITEVLRYLNVSPEISSWVQYDFKIHIRGIGSYYLFSDAFNPMDVDASIYVGSISDKILVHNLSAGKPQDEAQALASKVREAVYEMNGYNEYIEFINENFVDFDKSRNTYRYAINKSNSDEPDFLLEVTRKDYTKTTNVLNVESLI